ncbi:STAS/SEC14 domain-containing protein [Hymenobacter sp. B81]|uniref:STAS/SEC14 domain-containing protein n=1 Tax=Hymenobacter sp. B81 TaxID=3344878 RepID=UPI0037DCAE32
MLNLYDSPCLRLDYLPRLRLLEIAWRGAAQPRDIREGFWQALEVAEQYQVQCWLHDLRGLPPVGPAEQHWLRQHWFPRYLLLKLHRVALVNSPDEHRRLSVEATVRLAAIDQHDYRPDTRYFDDAEQARAWIRAPHVTALLPRLG